MFPVITLRVATMENVYAQRVFIILCTVRCVILTDSPMQMNATCKKHPVQRRNTSKFRNEDRAVILLLSIYFFCDDLIAAVRCMQTS